MVFSRGEAIALWTGVIMFVVFLGFCFFRLCSLFFRTMLVRVRPAKKKRKLNPQEKKINKILSNQNAREILKSRAITAINSQANKSRRGFSSQFSLDSLGTVPDLTERVVRVSFAPTGSSREETGTLSVNPPTSVPENLASDQEAEAENYSLDHISHSGASLGGRSNPPDYDTLSTHSRVSASDPPPEYSAITVPE